jgi:hypothetical protein
MYIRNGNNIHVSLSATGEAASYTIKLELLGVKLKILHNNMQRYKNNRIICRKF